MFIPFVWLMMIIFSFFGASMVDMDFSLELFLVPGEPITNYAELAA